MTSSKTMHDVFCEELERTKAGFSDEEWNAMSRAEQFEKVDILANEELYGTLLALDGERTKAVREQCNGTVSRFEELARMNLTEEEMWVTFRLECYAMEHQSPAWIVADKDMMAAKRQKFFASHVEHIEAKRRMLGL